MRASLLSRGSQGCFHSDSLDKASDKTRAEEFRRATIGLAAFSRSASTTSSRTVLGGLDNCLGEWSSSRRRWTPARSSVVPSAALTELGPAVVESTLSFGRSLHLSARPEMDGAQFVSGFASGRGSRVSRLLEPPTNNGGSSSRRTNLVPSLWLVVLVVVSLLGCDGEDRERWNGGTTTSWFALVQRS